MQISDRLKTIAGMIEHRRLADIGTDHAYVPIYAALNGIIDYALACDIKKGPLIKAEENIRRYRLMDKIETRLGAGLEPLKPKEAETVVIAGMGGMLINEILDKGAAEKGIRQLILQPQLDIQETRKFLHKINFQIDDEEIIFEENKFYFVLNCHKGTDLVYNDKEFFISKALVKKKDPVYKFYIEKQMEKLDEISKRILPADRASELAEKRELLNEVLECL